MKAIPKYLQSGQITMSMEYTGIILSVLIFLSIPYAIRLVDMSAAPIDPGIYSAIILAVSAILIFKAATWWIIKVIWPLFAEYSVQYFECNFKSLHSFQKVLIYLGFYLAVFYAFVIVLSALL